MTPSRHHHAELEPLIRSMLDGALDENGWTQLADLLRRDAGARDAYLHITMLHASLNWQAGRTQGAAPSSDSLSIETRAAGRIGHSWRWAAAAALIAVAVTAWFMRPHDKAPPSAPQPSPSPAYAMLSDLSDDAAFADGASPASLGGDLPPGPLSLTAGRAQVMLDGGAVVDLVGPCEFETIGPNRGRLTRGRVEAYVRPEAHGFTIDTPAGVRVIDLGTRFELLVGPAGATEVFVHEGRVRVEFGGRGEVFESGAAVRLAQGQWVVRHLSAEAIIESFDQADAHGLHAALEDRAGVYTYAHQVARSAGERDYIRTRAADFAAKDFVAEVTFTLPPDATGPNIVFFGIGEGVPDRSEWDNPAPALYFEAPPMRVESDRGAGSDDVIAHQFKEPGPGTHRLQIRKLGDAISFAIDEHYDGGSFHADQSCTLSWSAAAPFLDATNSRIFFGAQQAQTPSTFDDLSIRMLTGSTTQPPIHQEN